MEEVPDEQYEESEKAPEEHEEPVEPVEPAEPEPVKPEPKVCKPVKKDLKEKIQCACGRWMSQHTYKYQHKCKAQTVDEASKPPVPPEAPPEAPPPLLRPSPAPSAPAPS